MRHQGGIFGFRLFQKVIVAARAFGGPVVRPALSPVLALRLDPGRKDGFSQGPRKDRPQQTKQRQHVASPLKSHPCDVNHKFR